MKAVLHFDAGPGLVAALAEAGRAAGVETAVIRVGDRKGFAREMADAQALLHVLTPVTAEMMDAAPSLGLIQKIGVGVNTIDLAAAEARGVAVCNMPGSNSQAVAELALALILAVLRRVPTLDRAMRAGGGWRLDPALHDGVGEVAGRTVGFVGFGGVPMRLAPVIEALGGRVLYTARTPKPGREAAFRTLHDLLAETDVLSLHAPLTPETRGLIDAAALARLPPGAILVNTARGELVDEVALAAALASGRLRGAGLDVFAHEPVDGAHPLAAFDTVVSTPHAGWLTPETLARSISIAMANVLSLARGEILAHRVA